MIERNQHIDNAFTCATNEIRRGDHFGFGRSWQRYIDRLDESRIAATRESLAAAFGRETFSDESFIDIGCGTGLFGLAARPLGARVHSYDFDPDSVNCTIQLRERYFPNDADWTIECGSVLDEQYVASLGQFSMVYSWGVLHHTGSMWDALECAASAVAVNGALFISIYNDQGYKSQRWLRVKSVYNANWLGRIIVAGLGVPYLAYKRLKGSMGARLRGQVPKKKRRGMAFLSDAIDWLGGYPFEVARPKKSFDFYKSRGFDLIRLTTTGGVLGCNEFLFRRNG